MKYATLTAAIQHAKSHAGKRPTTSKIFNFNLRGWGAGGGQIYMKGQTLVHIWSYNGFSGSYDAKWEAGVFRYDGYKENSPESIEKFLEVVTSAAKNQ